MEFPRQSRPQALYRGGGGLWGGQDGPHVFANPLERPWLSDLPARSASWAAPRLQTFPTTAGGIFTGRNAGHVWDFEGAGPNFTAAVGGEVLEPVGTIGYQRRCNGFYNGTDMFSRLGWTPNAASLSLDTNYLRPSGADATKFDFGSSSFAVLVVFSYPSAEGLLSTLRTPLILKTDEGVGGDTNAIGWQIRKTSSNIMDFRLYDGANLVAPSMPNTRGVIQGGWHAVLAICDRTAGVAKVYFDGGEGPAVALGPLGSISATSANDFLRVGTCASGGNAGSARWQYKYLAIFTGADAEGITYEGDFLGWWLHGRDTNEYSNANPGGVVHTRTTGAFSHVGDSAAGEEYAGWAAHSQDGLGRFLTQPAYARRAAFSHASKIGVQIESPKAILGARSNEFDNATWTKTNITVTANSDAEACPGQTRQADKLDATIVLGRIQQSITVAGNVKITGSVVAKRDAADAAGVVYLNDATIDQATQAFTAGALWARRSVGGTWAGTTARFGVQVDMLADDIRAWHGQMEYGELSSPFPTGSGGATRTAASAMFLLGTGRHSPRAGEVEVRFVCNTHSQAIVFGGSQDTRAIFDLCAASGFVGNDRVLCEIASDNTLRLRIWDRLAVLVQDFSRAAPADWTAQHTVIARWDSNQPIDPDGRTAEIELDGGVTAGAAVNWSTGGFGNSASRIYIGGHQGGLNYLNGVVADFALRPLPTA